MFQKKWLRILALLMSFTLVAAVAFAPVAAGMQAYIEYANENNLVDGHLSLIHI